MKFRIIRRHLAALAGNCLRDCRGLAAMEFVFVAPVVLLLVLTGVDATRYLIASEQINKLANSIGQMITVSTIGKVNYTDLQFYHDSAMVIFPDVLADAARKHIPWSQDISITMSSVQFVTTQTNCGSDCSYTPKIVWTSGSNPRLCGSTILQVADTKDPTPGTLPVDVYGPSSIIVVDIKYSFTSWFSAIFAVSAPIIRSIYLSPRYVSLITYQLVSGDNGIAVSCP